MKTPEVLYQKYGDQHVLLEQIAADYYGVKDAATVKRMFGKGEFNEIKPFKMRQSNQAPVFVDINILANVLDRRAKDGVVA
jgi:hypothetical protein